MAVGDIIRVDNSTTTATLANELIEFIRVVRKAIESFNGLVASANGLLARINRGRSCISSSESTRPMPSAGGSAIDRRSAQR